MPAARQNDGGDEGGGLRKSLMDFHAGYYSSNLMKLVVLGKESIDELSKIVKRCFSDVPDQSLSSPSYPGEPFGPDQLAKRLVVMSVSETRALEPRLQDAGT